jgi:competence protein ComEC
LNPIQQKLANELTGRDFILKPRQVGCSTLIEALFYHDTRLNANRRTVVIAHDLTFARAVSPSIAVISCGAGNSYGHPHQEALQALKATGAKVLRTDQVGTVVLTTDGQKLSYTTQMKTPRSTGLAPATSYESTAANQAANIGNRNSHIFHLPTCSTLPAEKNRVYFNSRDDAIAQGFRPCKRCNP